MVEKGPLPPIDLRELQEWFAQVITQPIDSMNCIANRAPSGGAIAEEALHYIKPSTTLESFQRIEIYNQQYWWRLLNTLHELFPTLVRLFGYGDFNRQIGFPYLCRFPPKSWSLSYLGCHLPYWVHRYYRGEDKRLCYYASQMDWAYQASFLAPELPCLTLGNGDASHLLAVPLQLQPHLFLFSYRHALFELRDRLLEEEADHWNREGLPKLMEEPRLYYILWRDHDKNVGWHRISYGEWQLLRQFRKTSSLERLIDWIEGQESSFYGQVAEQLRHWTHRWICNGWLGTALECKRQRRPKELAPSLVKLCS